jgi:hypothetical protein
MAQRGNVSEWSTEPTQLDGTRLAGPSSLSSERSAEAILLEQTVRARLQNGKQPQHSNTTGTAGDVPKELHSVGGGNWLVSKRTQTLRQLFARATGDRLSSLGHAIAQLCKAVGRWLWFLLVRLRMLWRHRYTQQVRWRAFQRLQSMARWLYRQLAKIGILLQHWLVRMLGRELFQALALLCESLIDFLRAVCLVAKCFLLQFVAPSIYRRFLFIRAVYRSRRIGAVEPTGESSLSTRVARGPAHCATWSPGKDSTALANSAVYSGSVMALSAALTQNKASGVDAKEVSDSRPEASAPNWSAVVDQVDDSTIEGAQLRPHSLPRRFKRRKERAVLQLIDFDDTSL